MTYCNFMLKNENEDNVRNAWRLAANFLSLLLRREPYLPLCESS